MKASSFTDFEAARRFVTCCLRFTTGVAARHARLASGWRAAPLPGGSRTRWIATRGFSSCHPPLQGLPWRNNPRYRRLRSRKPGWHECDPARVCYGHSQPCGELCHSHQRVSIRRAAQTRMIIASTVRWYNHDGAPLPISFEYFRLGQSSVIRCPTMAPLDSVKSKSCSAQPAHRIGQRLPVRSFRLCDNALHNRHVGPEGRGPTSRSRILSRQQAPTRRRQIGNGLCSQRERTRLQRGL